MISSKNLQILIVPKMTILKNNSTRCEKEVADISSPNLTQIWSNEIINQNFFPANLKLAYVTPVFKKIDTTLAENYRAHYQRYQRCLRNSCKNSLTIVSTNFYLHFSVAT